MNVSDVYRHSLVIAFDYRIPDPSRVGPLLARRTKALADMGAHHVLVYRSTHEHGRVLVMTGVRSREPIENLMRSGVLMGWFDSVGVEDIPAVFAGEIIERFDLTRPGEVPLAPGVVVAGIVSVDDVAILTAQLRVAADRFTSFGIRKLWVFQALDDPQEVLILQDVVDEASARRWMAHPDAATEWMSHAGVGVYPPLFIGEFDRMVRIDGAD
ncbi:fatty-acid--CoA ligase [Mycolicibacterium komossense]|uniref:Fatty-acid--CoA ligase n=1 Tax=Mycolicibacterium komossense TaxID=1779 RepID=A0ABT3CHG8_9MYCO|nr:fatty-acid--CoA ligase [Mycolicibacterium komossense]MCV7228966.1 fatty-acid--CoA ligase [Mycolicibacterium komossense]